MKERGSVEGQRLYPVGNRAVSSRTPLFSALLSLTIVRAIELTPLAAIRRHTNPRANPHQYGSNFEESRKSSSSENNKRHFLNFDTSLSKEGNQDSFTYNVHTPSHTQRYTQHTE